MQTALVARTIAGALAKKNIITAVEFAAQFPNRDLVSSLLDRIADACPLENWREAFVVLASLKDMQDGSPDLNVLQIEDAIRILLRRVAVDAPVPAIHVARLLGNTQNVARLEVVVAACRGDALRPNDLGALAESVHDISNSEYRTDAFRDLLRVAGNLGEDLYLRTLAEVPKDANTVVLGTIPAALPAWRKLSDDFNDELKQVCRMIQFTSRNQHDARRLSRPACLLQCKMGFLKTLYADLKPSMRGSHRQT